MRIYCKFQVACCAVIFSLCVLGSINYRLAAYSDHSQKVLLSPFNQRVLSKPGEAHRGLANPCALAGVFKPRQRTAVKVLTRCPASGDRHLSHRLGHISVICGCCRLMAAGGRRPSPCHREGRDRHDNEQILGTTLLSPFNQRSHNSAKPMCCLSISAVNRLAAAFLMLLKVNHC